MKNELNALDLLRKIHDNAIQYLSKNTNRHLIKKSGFDFDFYESVMFVSDGNVRLLSCSKHDDRIELSLLFVNLENLSKIGNALIDIIYEQAEQKFKENKDILQQYHQNKLKEINEE